MTQAMGHGVNQRDLIKMTPEEVDAFLRERRSMTMSTISPDGSIHSVAMWYGFLEGAIAFETKAQGAEGQEPASATPASRVSSRRATTYDQLRGVSLVGTGEVIDDPDAHVGARGQRVRALQRARTPKSSSRSSKRCSTSAWW